jgi:hypothetical protein
VSSLGFRVTWAYLQKFLSTVVGKEDSPMVTFMAGQKLCGVGMEVELTCEVGRRALGGKKQERPHEHLPASSQRSSEGQLVPRAHRVTTSWMGLASRQMRERHSEMGHGHHGTGGLMGCRQWGAWAWVGGRHGSWGEELRACWTSAWVPGPGMVNEKMAFLGITLSSSPSILPGAL